MPSPREPEGPQGLGERESLRSPRPCQAPSSAYATPSCHSSARRSARRRSPRSTASITRTTPASASDEGSRTTRSGSGAFSEHRRYGRQFSVETFRSDLPRSPEGVAVWLRTRVPGVGPTFARAIVDHFGAGQVFAELDRQPERLREVRTKAGRAIS